MGIKDWFSKKKPSGPDVLHLTLDKMKPGYMVDYDMKTWEVMACNKYDWGEGEATLEWQLQSGDEILYLELESDDENDWSLSRKLPFRQLDPGIKDHILHHDNPPDEIDYDGVTYYLEESAAGHFIALDKGDRKPLLRWSYEDDDGKRYLGIEQWGEDDFDASLGRPVEEYQFQNILLRET